jgi:hypothetical protein
MKKILLATLALSTFAATSAMAAPARHQARALNQAITADTVVSDGTVIGKDPDAYVRFELLRDAASPNQG